MEKNLTANLMVLIGGTLSLLYLAIVPAFDIPRKIIDSVQYEKTGDDGAEGLILLASWVVLGIFAAITSYGIYNLLKSSRNKSLKASASTISVTIAILILTMNFVLSFVFGLYYTANR